MRKILIGLMIIGFLLCLVRVGTWAFFSDTETSSGNIFTAGTWINNPSLSLDDAEVKTGESLINHSIRVSNSGGEPKDWAKNVELGVSVVKGEEYLTQILYEPVIGNIEAGGVREFSLTVELNKNWSNAPDGEEVKLKIEVTREDNWREHNIERKAHFTIIKGGG